MERKEELVRLISNLTLESEAYTLAKRILEGERSRFSVDENQRKILFLLTEEQNKINEKVRIFQTELKVLSEQKFKDITKQEGEKTVFCSKCFNTKEENSHECK